MSNQIINLVCSHHYNKFLSKIKDYKIDLGKRYSKKDEFNHTLEPAIQDTFVIDFFKESKVLIYKVGVLGPISIYTYSNLQPHEVIVHKDNTYHNREIDLLNAEHNIEKSLAELLWSLDKQEE
jgi:hypothetical protein